MAGVRSTVSEAAALRAEAIRLYEARQWQRSSAAFTELTGSDEFVAEAYYGLGMIALETEMAKAPGYFEQALERDPRHANSLFKLGELADIRGDARKANDYYSRALDSEPNHAGALRRIGSQRSETVRPRQATDSFTAPPAIAPPRPPRPDNFDATSTGLVGFLREDNSPLSLQAVRIIDSMRLKTRPAFSATLGRVVRRTVVLGALVAAGAVASRGHSTKLAAAVGAALWLLLTLRHWVIVRTTRITIDDGRVYVESGVLRRSLEAFDLWRMTDTQLKRSLLNRVTRDGTIILSAKNYRKLELTGIVKGRARLEELRKNFQDLEFALRSNPVVKGIIS